MKQFFLFWLTLIRYVLRLKKKLSTQHVATTESNQVTALRKVKWYPRTLTQPSQVQSNFQLRHIFTVFLCANFTLLKGPKTLFMFINFEPGYHVLYLPLDRFHLHNDWLFSDSCLVGAVNPFSHPTYSNRISRDSTQPEDTEVVSCWNRLLAPKFWKFCEKNKKLREAYFPAV